MKNSSTILIVEDNPGDIRLIKEAFKTSSIDPTLYFARDGVEATHFLETRKREPSHGFPQLIVLDLNLPKKSGFEVLQFVKRDETLKRIPVIVLSSRRTFRKTLPRRMICTPLLFDQTCKLRSLYRRRPSLGIFWIRTANLPSIPDTRLSL